MLKVLAENEKTDIFFTVTVREYGVRRGRVVPRHVDISDFRFANI